jgi:predicted nucleic acid-binding protein
MVAAIRSQNGASHRLLENGLKERYRVLLSVPLMLEYEAVLTRAEHLEAARLTRDDVGAILDALAVIGEVVRLSFLWRPILVDPRDDMVLETAVNGRANLLVTLNRRHFEPTRTFGIDVVSPAEALDRMRQLK